MLSKCANPGCSASFRYLHRGKLFRWDNFHRSNGNGPGQDTNLSATASDRRVEFFWLCEDCAQQMTLVHQKGAGVVTQPFYRKKAAAAATSALSARSAG